MVAGAEEPKKILNQLIKSVMNEVSKKKMEDNGDKDE